MHNKKCLSCGKLFSANAHNKLYCSAKCRKFFHHKNKKKVKLNNTNICKKCDALIKYFNMDFYKLRIVDGKNIDNISLNNLWSEQSYMCQVYNDCRDAV